MRQGISFSDWLSSGMFSGLAAHSLSSPGFPGTWQGPASGAGGYGALSGLCGGKHDSGGMTLFSPVKEETFLDAGTAHGSMGDGPQWPSVLPARLGNPSGRRSL